MRRKLALIGMSNIGKSWLAAKLSDALGVPTVEVDHYIRRELGQSTMDDFAHWLGHPNTEGYAEREAKSLALEDTATLAALDDLPEGGILDTTGSVIYCERASKRLREETEIVYLRASDAQVQTLERLYFQHPKPLNWNGFFDQREGELFGDAVARCYPALLAARHEAYSALAHRTVPAEAIYAETDAKALLALVQPPR